MSEIEGCIQIFGCMVSDRHRKTKLEEVHWQHNIWSLKREEMRKGTGIHNTNGLSPPSFLPSSWLSLFPQRRALSVLVKHILIFAVQLLSESTQTAGKLRKCETNKVKWSQEIMQRGHVGNYVWETTIPGLEISSMISAASHPLNSLSEGWHT